MRNIVEGKGSQTRREYVYAYLFKNIIDLTLPPGSGLSEKEIGTILNVSRTPVREAMIQLVKDNLVEIVPQVGTYVSLIDPDIVEESRLMREILELAIGKLAAEKMDTRSILALEQNLHLQRLAISEGNHWDFLTYDDEFHAIIFRSLNMQRTWEVIDHLSGQYKRVRMMRLLTTEPASWEMIAIEHENLFVALREKDVDQVEKRMKEHLTKGIYHLDEFKFEHPDYFKK
ncbi:GntR family transcriptional regulator [Bacillus sp. B15-48]|uniref:GntR family transcriptional regulator n=1 Tax=Bacillus sp. B15-48 TaxID=1548601 RepID=UPI00193EFD58|nr:GntR family transcriptional regulator [Bacillus sp. B15-48]MBM4761653.1 FCD domain-containing protein [Bacillus sp. B15-48]